MHTLFFDGSFEGFLTCIFEVYERKLSVVSISAKRQPPDVFATMLEVTTESMKAKRVWEGLKKRLSPEGVNRVYYTFLSELDGMYDVLLEFVRYCFSTDRNIEDNHGHPAVLKVAQTARKVWREKHRMEAFVRFSLVKDGFFYAGIEPDHDVLPLINRHFTSRYADQDWVIYDIKRKYGLYYQKRISKTEMITLDWAENIEPGQPEMNIFVPEEAFYQQLWKDYFKHTGIPERKNLKLHIRHVPRRYWKYLPEKQ